MGCDAPPKHFFFVHTSIRWSQQPRPPDKPQNQLSLNFNSQGLESIPQSRSLGAPSNSASYHNRRNPRVQQPTWLNKRPKKNKSKKVKLIMWEHEFVCLADHQQLVPPSPMDKIDLIRARLGPKKIPWEFHDDIIGAFPKLANCGGYELLRTKQSNNRERFVIPSQSGGYTVQ